MRVNAIQFIKDWTETMMIDFKEPIRSGVPKGDLIGFGAVKKRAIYYMTLFPRTLNLKEIGEMVGTSEHVIQVWRTQKPFRDEIEKTNRILGEMIANTLEMISIKQDREVLKEFKLLTKEQDQELQRDLDSITEGSYLELKPDLKDSFAVGLSLIDLLPFFDHSVCLPLIEHTKKKRIQNSVTMRSFFLRFMESLSVFDNITRRKWEIETLNFTKLVIDSLINTLTDSEIRKRMTREELKDLGDFFRVFLYDKLDALAIREIGRRDSPTPLPSIF